MSFSKNQYLKDKFVVLSLTEKKTKSGDDYWLVELAHTQGQLPAKVWSKAIPLTKIQPNTVAYLEGRVDEYQGQVQLSIDSGRTLPDELIEHHLPAQDTPALIFDIETVGQDFTDLDEAQQDYLLNNLEKNNEDKEEAKHRTGLYALFGQVVCIACYQSHRRKGVILGLGRANLVPADSNYRYQACPDEKALLTAFWQLAEPHHRFVTFNGHNFDFPFLVFRSAVHRVRIPFPIETKTDNFIDLMRAIHPSWGRSFKLEMVAKALGISNPKEEGISGEDVKELFEQGKHQQIADYAARDVTTTHELYLIWKNYLAGKIVI